MSKARKITAIGALIMATGTPDTWLGIVLSIGLLATSFYLMGGESNVHESC